MVKWTIIVKTDEKCFSDGDCELACSAEASMAEWEIRNAALSAEGDLRGPNGEIVRDNSASRWVRVGNASVPVHRRVAQEHRVSSKDAKCK